MTPSRLFTVAEAQEALPVVREELETMRECLAYLRRISTSAGLGGNADETLGDDVPGSPVYSWALARLEAAQRRLVGLGVEIRDVDRGLVDFPALHGDQVVLLCWLEGEPEVGWFHDRDSGFPGRRPLAEFEPQA